MRDLERLESIISHLEAAEREIVIAIGEFGPRAGSWWAGSWAEYRRLVGVMLRLRVILKPARSWLKRLKRED